MADIKGTDKAKEEDYLAEVMGRSIVTIVGLLETMRGNVRTRHARPINIELSLTIL